jgi:hypothetical protein
MNCMDINGNLAQSVLRTNVNPKKNQSVKWGIKKYYPKFKLLFFGLAKN